MKRRLLSIVVLAALAVTGLFAATAVARDSGAGTKCTTDVKDGGRYEISLGVLAPKAARELRARVAHDGFGVRFEREGCTTALEVAVGRFARRTAAAAVLRRLERLGFRGSIEFDRPLKTPAPQTTSTTTTTAEVTTTTAAGGGGGGGGGGDGSLTTTTTATTPASTTTTTTTKTTTTPTTTAPPPCTLEPTPDKHHAFEAVFGRTTTFAAAQQLATRVHRAGFPRAGIEVDSCTEFEVAIAQFKTRAGAAFVVERARELGFDGAEVEES